MSMTASTIQLSFWTHWNLLACLLINFVSQLACLSRCFEILCSQAVQWDKTDREATNGKCHRRNYSDRCSQRRQCIHSTNSTLIPTDLPFEFKRLQFPVRPAFAMTINKAQGQSLSVAGMRKAVLFAKSRAFHMVSCTSFCPVLEHEVGCSFWLKTDRWKTLCIKMHCFNFLKQEAHNVTTSDQPSLSVGSWKYNADQSVVL